MLPAFGLASPWLLAGLALGAVPVIIHLLFRRPHREIPWAATRFLLAATQKHARRLRLEQLILLAVRAALLMVVAAALARPFFAQPGTTAGIEPATQRVLVLDTSYSMGYDDGSGTRLDHAAAAATALLEAARTGDAFHLVQMTDLGPGVVVGRPAYQPTQVADAVAELTPTAGRADPIAALRAAADLLRQVPELPAKEIVIFSDFQTADWQPTGARAAELRRTLAEVAAVASIRRVDVRGGDAHHPDGDAGNAAVTDLVVESPLIRTGVATRLVATVRQFGGVARQGVRAELHIDGRLTATESLALRPHDDTTVAFSHTFTDAGPQRVEVRLGAAGDGLPLDALSIDNARFLAMEVRDRLRVLLVDGHPGRGDRAASFFLKRALAPGGSTSDELGSDFEPLVISDGDLAGQDLSGFDAVVLANVGVLTDREAGRLHAFAAAGGGLVIALGDEVLPEGYNRVLADAGADALLPVRLGSRVGDPLRPDRAMLFDTTDLSHPIVRPFAGNPGTGLDSDFVLAYARATVSAADATAAESPATIALRFDTGDPAIITAPLGAGRAVLLTTSVDTSWAGPWPQAGRSFLPLMHEMVRYAATGRPAASVRVGEPVVWTVPARVAGLTAGVTFADGSTPESTGERLPAVVTSEGLCVVLEQTARPGVVTLSLPAPVDRTTAFAVNVDAAEGDLAGLSAAELAALAPEATPTTGQTATSGLPDWPLSRWLLAVALGLLLAEPLLAWRFRWGMIALALLAVVLAVRGLWLFQPLAALALAAVAVATAFWLWQRGGMTR